MQEQSRQARETQKALAAYGIPSEIVSWSQSNAGGVTTTMQGEASTLADGTVFIKNDAGILEDGTTEYTPREMAGHEMAHEAQRRAPAECQAYYDAATDELNLSSDQFVDYSTEIADAYFTRRGKDFDITRDYAVLYDELLAYVSGSILENEAAARQKYANMFYDFDSVVEAWKRMESAMRRQGGQSTTQADSGSTPESAFLDTSARGDNVDAIIRDVFGYGESKVLQNSGAGGTMNMQNAESGA